MKKKYNFILLVELTFYSPQDIIITYDYVFMRVYMASIGVLL